MKKCLMLTVIVSAIALIAFAAFAEEEKKDTRVPPKPPAEKAARTRPPRGRMGARPGRPGQTGQRPQMNREQWAKQRIETSEKAVVEAKKEQKTIMGELKAILALAEKEKAKEIAARIEKLIKKLGPKYQKAIKSAEERLKRTKDALERGIGARTRPEGAGGPRGQRGSGPRGGGFGGGQGSRGGGFGGGRGSRSGPSPRATEQKDTRAPEKE